MNHSFIKSLTENSCAKCHRSETDHSLAAQCEACPNIGPCDLFGSLATTISKEEYDRIKAGIANYETNEPTKLDEPSRKKLIEQIIESGGNILLCQSCLKKEYQTAVDRAKNNSANWETDKINIAITNPIGAILKSVDIDNALQVSTDFFNAETTSIVELRAACSDDFQLAQLIQQRYQHFKSVLFDIDAARLNLHSRQKAQAVALNELASKLSAEQREQLKIKDLNYVAQEPPKKSVSKPKLTIEEKMAMNLVEAKLVKMAQSLVDDKTCTTIDEAKSVARSRGLVMSIEQARLIVAKTFGSTT